MFSSARKFHPLRAAASAGLKGALPKVLLGAALLGGGSSVLFAGSASAITLQQWIDAGAAGITVPGGDKTFVYGSHTGLPLTGDDDIDFSVVGSADYFLLYDFRTPNFSAITNFTLNYSVSITPAGIAAGNTFASVDNDTTVSQVNTALETLATTFSCNPPVPLTSTNGSSNVAVCSGGLTTLNVTNTYSRNGADGAISNFQNSFHQGGIPSVPGPLPLLGAGIAFGFSRKLRSRIKARVQA